ncbi:PREDICTED: uncharacterized protein LOC104800265 [Tarenaya hassleriana]|uniref:uncharacterized protein LOC104800265 n=1 Tax=Tarenaya hassleriana TaxID=28532 RepID=UPI00053C1B78|nr:PREDICTED: uncharacterized protein LOC104800265 [Tarenaya hassleriana]
MALPPGYTVVNGDSLHLNVMVSFSHKPIIPSLFGAPKMFRTALTAIQVLKSLLSRQFHIKDLGSLKFFLGLEIARSRQGIVVNQRKYCLELIEDVVYSPASQPLLHYI